MTLRELVALEVSERMRAYVCRLDRGDRPEEIYQEIVDLEHVRGPFLHLERAAHVELVRAAHRWQLERLQRRTRWFVGAALLLMFAAFGRVLVVDDDAAPMLGLVVGLLLGAGIATAWLTPVFTRADELREDELAG